MNLLFWILVLIIAGIIYSGYHKVMDVYYLSGKAFFSEIIMILIISCFLAMILISLCGAGLQFVLTLIGNIIAFLFSSIWIIIKVLFIGTLLFISIFFVKAFYDTKIKKKKEDSNIES